MPHFVCVKEISKAFLKKQTHNLTLSDTSKMPDFVVLKEGSGY